MKNWFKKKNTEDNIWTGKTDLEAIDLEAPAANRFKAKPGVRHQVVVDIFNNYHEELEKYLLRRLDSREDAKEIAQEVFVRVLRKSGQEELLYPRAFIFTVAANLLKDRLRTKITHAVDRHEPITEDAYPCSAASPEQEVRFKESLDILARVLEQSRPVTKRAFILNRFKGLTYEQIASELDISRSMVKHHISSVLVDCRKALKGS
ncbi:sigma-70 family RNA polymerase sigma factor [uncultured Desulfobacter sp.]|uniref:sigma-70 family RNA polymerase sigma factor n=1 Tax=uncultured Desulfobacter sp. TaxID=240139 RepID=UPI002AAAEEBB|nr:sigma-70 family RNA polymerase sigma factor [uncultured Desulfobacter sp.]